jgi:PAS domain S-box-containing protein
MEDYEDSREVELLLAELAALRRQVAALEQADAEHQQTKAALQQERDFAESLIETAQVIVLVLDAQGRVVRFNPYMEEVSGYRLAEVQGRDWFSTFLPARDWPRIRPLFLQAIDDIQTRGNINPIITKDGHEREIEWYDKTLKDTDGRTIGLLAVGQDVTERLQVEAELHDLNAELQSRNEAIEAALKQVKTLSGLLPICADCKKIRDDTGYWMQIEVYIRNHSELDFSHGLCPECMQKLYPELFKEGGRS